MKKNKHDHKGTKALKLSIFFTLMLAPFLAVLFKCAYVTFNKNAKDSYSKQEIETNIRINSISEYSSGLTYTITATDNPPSSNSGYLTLDYFSLTAEDLAITQNQRNSITKWLFTSGGLIVFADNNNNWIKQLNFGNANRTIETFKFVGDVSTQTFSYVVSLIQTQPQPLDNAFYYAIDEAMESPYFAWARTSALYTATSGLTNGMGITTQAIPTLIVYWLILTAIYIIIDIVIESFTYLTHCIMNRFD